MAVTEGGMGAIGARAGRSSRGALAALALVGCGPPGVSADLGLSVAVERPAEGLCVSVQLDRWDPAHRDAQVDALLALGVAEIRQDLRWGYVERSPGSFDWTTEDAVIDAATGAGLRVIAMLGYGNGWANADGREFAPPDDPADFAAFAGAAAARYADRIDRYEIWNEPNSGFRFWQVGTPAAIGGDPAGYAALFAPAAAAVHAADPGAEVELGSVFFHAQAIPGGPAFVADAVAADPALLEVADAVSFHPYTLYPPSAAPEDDSEGEVDFPQMVAAMAQAAPGLPLVVTEMGWPVWGEVDEALQAAYTVRGIALLHGAGVRDACVYTLEDHEGEVTSPEDAFGLASDLPGGFKPVGEDLARFATALQGVDAALEGGAQDALGLPDGVVAVRYLEAGGDVLTLLWSVAEERVEVVLPHVEGLPRCALVDGEVVDVSRDGVALRVGPRPKLVRQGGCGE